MSTEYSYSERKAKALKRGFENEHGEAVAGALSGAFSRAIGKQESGDAYTREKLEVDQVSVQFLMGHDVSQALRFNSSAQRVKTSQENRRKGRDSRRSLELLRQLTEQLAVIERLIDELEARIELLRSQARECREEALLLFEQADAMEDLLEGGLEEHERAEAIRLLRVSSCNEDLDLIDLEQLSVLLVSQINSARDVGADTYQRGEDITVSVEEMERELAKRKQEVEALKKELTSFPTEEEKFDEISQACLRLKEDLLSMSSVTPYTVAVRQDVAIEKRSANTPENYEFDTEGEIANLDLESVGPGKGF